MKIWQLSWAVLLVLAGCDTKKEAKELPPAKVTLGESVEKTVPYLIRTVGNTSPVNSINIRPQVSGEILNYAVIEGSEVEEGAVIATIDPRTYEAVVEEIKGLLSQAEANYTYNAERVERYKGLLPEDFVSLLDFHVYVSMMQVSKGQIEQYQGQLKDAEVNLGYCTITSPIKGVCGLQLINAGNIVAANQTAALCTVNQMQPMYALFTVAERDFFEIEKYHRTSKEGLDIEIYLLGNTECSFKGKLNYIDNQVDTATGTLLLRAEFPNEEKGLWPGQFVHAAVELYQIPHAIVIAEQAVQYDTKGAYVFVAKSDGTVEKRGVTLGQNINGERVVEKGVDKGESVVLEGQLMLRDGSRYVEAKEK